MLKYHSEATTRWVLSFFIREEMWLIVADADALNKERAIYFKKGSIVFSIIGFVWSILYLYLAILGVYTKTGFFGSFSVFWGSAIFSLLGNKFLIKQLECDKLSEGNNVSFSKRELFVILIITGALTAIMSIMITSI